MDYVPPATMSIPRTMTFALGKILVTAEAEYTLRSKDNNKDYVTVNARLDHVYDEEMTRCEQITLTTEKVDVSHIPPERQGIIHDMLNANIRVLG